MLRELSGWRALVVAVGALVLVCSGMRDSHAQPAAAATSSAEALRIYEGAANAQNQKAYELAAEEWAEFLRRFPRDPLAAKARYYEGVCHLQLRGWEPAIAAFSAVVRENPRFELLEDTLLNLGWSQFSAAEEGDKEQFSPAIQTFSQLLEKFPEGKRRDEALFFRAECLYALEQRGEAVASYRELVQNHADSRLRCDALYAMGVALEELEDFTAAGRAYDQLLSDCSSYELITEVRMRKAETLLQTSYVEAADQLFGEVAAVEGFAAADHALARQAACRARQEKYSESGKLHAQLVQRFPQSPLVPEAELAAGRAFYRAKDFQSARQWFQAAVRRSGDATLEAVHWLSRIHLQEDRPEDAEQLVKAHREQATGDPLEPDLLVDLADAIYQQPSRREEALALYLEVADRHTQHRQAPQALYNAAFAALELRRFDQSIELTARFLAEYPEDPLAADILLLAVEANLDKRNFTAAERHMQALLATYSDRPEHRGWQLRLGLIRYVAGNYAGALQHLQTVLPDLETPDQIAEAQYLIGACHFFQDEFAKARPALESSLEASSKWRQADEATLLLARSYQRDDEWEPALETLDRFLHRYPDSGVRDQAYYRQGEIHYAREAYAEAIRSYQQVVQQAANSAFAPYALYGIGWSQIKLARFSEASRSFATLLERYADHELADSARLAAGMALRQEGRYREAVAELQKYLATNPPRRQRSDALYERGLAEGAEKQFDRAAATFVELLTADPDYAHSDKVLYELAWAYRSNDHADRSLAEFARLANDFPESPLAAEASFHLAEDLYQRREYQEALAPFQRAQQAASLSELKEKATYKLGWTHFQLKQYSEAAQQFAEQAASFPDGVLYGDALFMRGESLFQQGEYEPAWAAFQLARKTRPSSEQMEVLTLLHAAQCASQLKKFPEAIELLDELEAEFPENARLAEVSYERGWARQNLQELEKAFEDYQRAAAPRDALGARARFMMGELRFAQKQYDEAIREFQRAMYLYGGRDTPPDVKTWQAKAAYEAGRCSEVQVETAASAGQRASAIDSAKKFYTYVVQNHADDPIAAEARRRLEVLRTL